MRALANKMVAGASALFLLSAASIQSAKADAFDCKDPILNEPAFHLRIDPQDSTATLESTPTFIALDEIRSFPVRRSNGTLSWSMPQSSGSLEFFLDGKTGAVTVDKLSAGRRESLGSFSCEKAADANPQPETHIHNGG